MLVLTGTGRAFCAGGDLPWLQSAIDDPAVFERTAVEGKAILFRQLELTKPIIARLNGPAVGLGASLALFCDIIVAAQSAMIADPHVSVGLVAGDGGAIIWPQLVGYARAKEYLLTGAQLSAQEAERIGLINRVVPDTQLDAAVQELAQRWRPARSRRSSGPRSRQSAAQEACARGLRRSSRLRDVIEPDAGSSRSDCRVSRAPQARFRGPLAMTASALQLQDDVQTLAAYARRRALQYPDAVAFYETGRTISYATLLSEAQALAGGLWQIGLRCGDVVSFQLPNWIETAIINLAANLLGLRCNPIVPIYRDSELLEILSAARTRCFFVPHVWGGFDYAAMARRLRSNLPELQVVATVRADQPGSHDYETLMAAGRDAEPPYPELDPTDNKLLMFTSGTSGRAKGVLHSQASLVAPLLRACARWPLREHDCMLMPSPVTHITGYCCGWRCRSFSARARC